MNLQNFNPQQRDALLDLTTLAMYADGHLTSTEDLKVQRLLSAMGFSTEYDRARHYDASVARVRKHADTPATARTHALALAQSFATPEQRRQAHEILCDLAASDSKMAPQETTLLAIVRDALAV